MNKSLCWGLLASLFLYQSTHAVFFMDFGPQIACTGDGALKKYPQVCKFFCPGAGPEAGAGWGTGTLLSCARILTAKHIFRRRLMKIEEETSPDFTSYSNDSDIDGTDPEGTAYRFRNLKILVHAPAHQKEVLCLGVSAIYNYKTSDIVLVLLEKSFPFKMPPPFPEFGSVERGDPQNLENVKHVTYMGFGRGGMLTNDPSKVPDEDVIASWLRYGVHSKDRVDRNLENFSKCEALLRHASSISTTNALFESIYFCKIYGWHQDMHTCELCDTSLYNSLILKNKNVKTGLGDSGAAVLDGKGRIIGVVMGSLSTFHKKIEEIFKTHLYSLLIIGMTAGERKLKDNFPACREEYVKHITSLRAELDLFFSKHPEASFGLGVSYFDKAGLDWLKRIVNAPVDQTVEGKDDKKG